MATDIHSHAKPDQVRVTHLSLDLNADFDKKVLSGSVALDLDRTAPDAPLYLDTSELAIERVTTPDGKELKFQLEESDGVLGTPLRIDLDADTKRVVVAYHTEPGAAAVQWLSPEQTSGSHPFLFTQGQAILTRTWIPCQDSPGVRVSYDAHITVPEPLTALMSAKQLTPKGEAVDGGRRRFAFELDRAIPSYLIALAIGELEFRPLSDRAGVFAEPAVVDAAADEFVDTEKMIVAAEALYGPYRWGRYDILVLPSSFPFGGMENPCLTFATPTIIAGDRSLTALIAHELAHSWSGNLVTNAVWPDFWLNEGFTVYFEGRIMEAIYGKPYSRMLQVLGWQDLQDDLESFGAGNSDTQLQTILTGRNPDDAFSNIPYEKGALFLRTIEHEVGRERLDAFLRDYFDRFAFQPMTSERFLEHLTEKLFEGDESQLTKLRLREWIYEPGLPNNAVRPESDAFTKIDAAREAFLATGETAALAADAWSTHEWLHFLRGLGEETPEERLGALDDAFSLTQSGNNEILFEWLRIGIEHRREATFARLDEFLHGVGRRKFLKPLYQELVKSDWGRAMAKKIYTTARPGYHSVSSNTIDEILESAGS